MKKLGLVLLCLALVSLSACGGRGVQVRTMERTVLQELPATKVEQAIITAAQRLNWSARKVSGNTIEATLVTRGHEVVVDILYTAKGYEIKYKNSTNMRYDAEKQTIHGNYNRWLQRLDRNIQKEIRGM